MVQKVAGSSANGLVLLAGPESFLARRAVDSMRQQIVNDAGECRLIEVTGSELTSGELLDMLSPSLFGEPVMLVLDSPSDSQAAELIAIFDSNSMDQQSKVAVRLLNSAGSNVKIIKQLSPYGKVVACDEIKRDADRAQFIRAELQLHNKKISTDALAALQLAFTSDLAELAAACAQLAAATSGEIDRDLVEAIFSGRVETNAFKIADAALARDASTAIRLLRHGLNSGIDPIPLLAALSMRIRQLARVVSDRSITAAALGLAPWQFERVRKDLRGRSEGELIELVRMAADTDASLKGASRDPAYRLEKYVLAIATS